MLHSKIGLMRAFVHKAMVMKKVKVKRILEVGKFEKIAKFGGFEK